MLISGKNKFVPSPFTSEAELRNLVIENPNYFFGKSSFSLSKGQISDNEVFGQFTDGFVVDISNRKWFVINSSLSKYNVWNHIAPQVVRQLIAAEQPTPKRLLIELVMQQIKINKELVKKFSDEGYLKTDEDQFQSKIHNFLKEVFEDTPFISIPIDAISNDLRDWAATLKTDVKMSVIKKYVENDNSENIIYEIPEISPSSTIRETCSKNIKIDDSANDTFKSQNTVSDRLTEKIDVSEIPY